VRDLIFERGLLIFKTPVQRIQHSGIIHLSHTKKPESLDYPVMTSNRRGRVAFAMGYEPHDRTTQIYINLKDKPELDKINFAPIGEVIMGMNVVGSIYSEYGESAGGGIRGGHQDSLFESGNEYLKEYFPKLDFIIEALVIQN
jgi:homoserine O-acetyltransferase